MSSAPETGQIVRVRERRYVVTDVRRSELAPDPLQPQLEPQHLVALASVEDDAHGETLEVIWEIEPGARLDDERSLPEPAAFDDPARFDAFVDAVRWGAIASADARSLQAPFRSGVAIEDFQLEPLARALRMPRVNLLVADDVGLGKTIEAGLVLQELLLRHRARRVMVLCPSALQIKWRDELREKFGLEFRIVDTELMRDLRRRRGPHVNPWAHFPRLITSYDYLKRERPMQLFRHGLPAPGEPVYPRKWDLLIVDEAHNLAPSGRGRYATDSQRTRMLREISPHFEHRMFLTATPHNGYSESFSSLLAMLDDQRFMPDVPPDPKQLQAVMVRRLKDEPQIREWDGRRRFPERRIVPIEVEYGDDERVLHAELQDYSAWLVRSAREGGRCYAGEFVAKLLKKRLFSSPAAFRDTIEEHAKSVRAREQVATEPAGNAARFARLLDELDDEADDDVIEGETAQNVRQATRTLSRPDVRAKELLKSLRERAARLAERADARAQQLLDWLRATVRPGGSWGDKRVIVFTEYRSTQKWLHDLLAHEGFAADGRLELLYGGMETNQREAVKAAFQASPVVSAVRILLATDAASEGIDLQNHCSRLLHYEIPWNPMRLEQRNGRVDRRGQAEPEVLIHHFVPRGYETGRRDPQVPPGRLEGDLEFLARAAEKVENIRRDLGKVGPVIATQVEEAMLGGRRRMETEQAESEGEQVRRQLTFERRLAEELRKLTDQLQETRRDLHLSPQNVLHVVQTGLAVAERPPLERVVLPRTNRDGAPTQIEAWRLPPFDGSWLACAEGLAHPHTGVLRPVVFDATLADGHDDVVLAHLHHRLVSNCLRLLRGEMWDAQHRRHLHRVTARIVPDTALRDPVVVAHGRVVVLGGDQRRVHEEIIAAGLRLEAPRAERLGVGDTQAALEAATSEPVPASVQARFAEQWPRLRDPLQRALEARMRALAEGMQKKLAERGAREAADSAAILNELAKSIRARMTHMDFEQLELQLESERTQRQHNRDAMRLRLERIPAEIDAERRLIEARFASCEPRLFPFAVSFLVPARLAR
ncbi:MAG: DEAD/DEAH box helicase [Candidatus Eisenbacteria bacterium]|uniref:DEAD/DEAH box helicase n=1 Tax=Eiseniibacteriota bacterium TaxID=2212470 RepID=A0A933SD10_UNCEI|nr:DEAD/DEAH box helicase [Candidatus Eisenbacteria bacterium]